MAPSRRRNRFGTGSSRYPWIVNVVDVAMAALLLRDGKTARMSVVEEVRRQGSEKNDCPLLHFPQQCVIPLALLDGNDKSGQRVDHRQFQCGSPVRSTRVRNSSRTAKKRSGSSAWA